MTTKSKPTLYELLGITPDAGLAELQGAYGRAVQALEARRPELTPEQFEEREQVLRVAFGTLKSPSLRAEYDATLAAAARVAEAAEAPGVASTRLTRQAARADALGLRADALALRADAILARAELEGGWERRPSTLSMLMSGANGLARVLGLLVVVGAMAFGLTRCATGDTTGQRTAMDSRAMEQVRLQEYFQTYGVRPGSIAELERMEAERQRRETEAREARQAEQERQRREEAQRRWEEDARRTGASVSRDLQHAQEDARRQGARARELKLREEQLQLELHFAKSEAERQRLELSIRQLRERRTPQ